MRRDRLPVLPPRDDHISWIEAPHVAGQHHMLLRVKRSGFGYLHSRWPCIGRKCGHERGHHSGFFSNLVSFLLQLFVAFANLPSPPPRHASTHPFEKEELESLLLCSLFPPIPSLPFPFFPVPKLWLIVLSRSQGWTASCFRSRRIYFKYVS